MTDVQRSIEFLAAVQCVAVGTSHLFQPRAWVEFFACLRGLGRPGAFVNGLLSLWFGTVVVAFHNVWEGLPAVLTVLGWAQVLKGLVNLVFPDLGLRSMANATPQRSWTFVVGGVVLLALGGLFGYLALR